MCIKSLSLRVIQSGSTKREPYIRRNPTKWEGGEPAPLFIFYTIVFVARSALNFRILYYTLIFVYSRLFGLFCNAEINN